MTDDSVTIGPNFRLRLLNVGGGESWCWRDPSHNVIGNAQPASLLPTDNRACGCGADRQLRLRRDRADKQNHNQTGHRHSIHMASVPAVGPDVEIASIHFFNWEILTGGLP